jgi:hypothetical protein
MSTGGNLFRREALDFHTRGRMTSGGVVRLDAPWLCWSLRLLLLLVVAGFAACVFVRTNESSIGPAVVDGRDGSVALLLPVAVAPQLRSAHGLWVDATDAGSMHVIVTAARPVPAGVRIAALPTPTQPALLIRGRLAARGALVPRLFHGRATLVVRSERLGQMVLRQFRTILGREEGGA